MQKKWLFVASLLLIALTLLSACGSDDEVSTTATPQVAQGTLNSPVASNLTTSTNSSPVNGPAAGLVETPFQLVKPIKEGDTVIRGSGPPNIPIRILDITFMGQSITNGIIDSQGQFELPVPPLAKGHWVGVTVGDLSGSGYAIEDFQKPGFNGNEATVVPQIGFFYDTYTVEER
ncbi:MAG: hypothetical protein AAF629_20685 [Chloroflexota bacterium]